MTSIVSIRHRPSAAFVRLACARLGIFWAMGAALLAPAAAQISGDASSYNVFIFGSGSFTSQNTDTMGNLAVGGNASLSSYTVASGIAGNPSAATNPARLVVGGTLTATNGSVGSNGAGAIYTNAAPSLSGFTATGGVHAQNVIGSFSSDATQYASLATSLGKLTANGTTQLSGSTLDFKGTSQGLNVFTVLGSTITAANTINISAPVGSTVLVDILGNVTFQNGMLFETGVTASNVLFNAYQATSVDLVGGMNPEGSILAPDAGVVGGYGAMNGQLIAASYSGNTQFNASLFTGSLSAAPEASTLWLMAAGLLALGVLRRARSDPRQAPTP